MIGEHDRADRQAAGDILRRRDRRQVQNFRFTHDR